MTEPNPITIEQAVNTLTDAARRDYARVEARLTAAGFAIAAYRPVQATLTIDTSIAADIGEVIAGRGIYHGAWQPHHPNGVIVHAYSDTDLLKDAFGTQMLLTWVAAGSELARRNDGRRYGKGTEAALSDALARPPRTEGAYQDGDRVMGPKVLLNGFSTDGKLVRKGSNTVDLFYASMVNASIGEAFPKISKTLNDADTSGSDGGRLSWSCSEARDPISYVRAINLLDGFAGGYFRDLNRLSVLPFRFFREPHAAKAVNHLNI